MTARMTERVRAPVAIGLAGAALLIALGVWQLERRAWKAGILADIDARLAAAPVPLPADPDPARDRYLAVRLAGRTLGREIHVLASDAVAGPGYRIVAPFETDTGRAILVDLGFVPDAAVALPRPPEPLDLTGNLAWPDDADSFTPAPDLARNVWFSRDVPAMAKALGTEPVLVQVATTSAAFAAPRPAPLGTEGIPNNHLEYALTWFSLAAVWLGMTALWVWRIRQRSA